MIDFQLVDSPVLYPNACSCGNAKGKMIDTHFEVGPDGRRVYLCKRCCKRAAQIHGFAPGERMEQLENAAAELEQMLVEMAEKDARADKLTTERAQLRSRLEAEQVLREAAENKVKTLEHQVQIIRDNTIELQSIMAN